LHKDGICVFLKGMHYKSELEAARKSWIFESAIIPGRVNEQGVIITLQGLARRT